VFFFVETFRLADSRLEKKKRERVEESSSNFFGSKRKKISFSTNSFPVTSSRRGSLEITENGEKVRVLIKLVLLQKD